MLAGWPALSASFLVQVKLLDTTIDSGLSPQHGGDIETQETLILFEANKKARTGAGPNCEKRGLDCNRLGDALGIENAADGVNNRGYTDDGQDGLFAGALLAHDLFM